jgi:hypothetical protein
MADRSNIFLSYAHRDAKWARQLAASLKKRGLDVWFDDEINAGANVWEETGKALSQADAMVVLLSPDAVESTHVQREIDFALTERRFKNRLIPVVVRPTKNIPWILQKQPIVIARPHKLPAAFREVGDKLLASVE